MSEIDPRDRLHDATAALTGFVGLLEDLGRVDGGQFEAADAHGLASLLRPHQEQLEKATHELQGYVPRK